MMLLRLLMVVGLVFDVVVVVLLDIRLVDFLLLLELSLSLSLAGEVCACVVLVILVVFDVDVIVVTCWMLFFCGSSAESVHR